METIQFKTNIKCAGCVANVSPELNHVIGKNNWKVDTQSTDKILTVTKDGISETDIKTAVEKVGYKAEKI